MPGTPTFDPPTGASLSGPGVAPHLVVAEILKVYRELQTRYDAAKFAGDPVDARALGECCDAIGGVLERWQEPEIPDGRDT